MKKKIGIFSGLAVVAALVGYFAVLPELEKKQAAQVASFIDELPGDLSAGEIRVRLLSGTVEVLGLKGNTKYIDGSDMTVDVARIAVSGVNFTPGEGVVTLLDEAEFENANVRISTRVPSMDHGSSALDKSIVQNQTLKKMTVKGLRGDYAGLRAAIKADQRAGLYECLADFTVAEVFIAEYATQVESAELPMPVSMRVQLMTAKNAGLLKSGPSSAEGISISILGSESLRIGSMTVASCSVPNMYLALVEARDNNDFETFAGKLFSGEDGESLAVEGLVIHDLSFKLLMPDSLTIGTLGVDFSFAKNRLVFKNNITELVVPVSMYRNLGMEAAQFANYYGQPIVIDAALDSNVRWESGRADLDLHRLFIEDKNLGSASFSAVLYATGEGDTLEEFLDGAPEPYLVKADVMLEDKAFLANIFGGEFEAIKAFGLTGDGMESPGALRNQAVAAFEAEVAGIDNADQKAVAEGLSKLLTAPGKLTVSLAPATPVKIDGDEAALNAKVEYSATAKPASE